MTPHQPGNEIVWHQAPAKRRLTAYGIDWGITMLLTAVIIAPATMEWDAPHIAAIPVNFGIYLIWQFAWLTTTGRSCGQHIVGIWILADSDTPVVPDQRQRLVIAGLWAVASLPPLLIVLHPAIAYTWIRSTDQRHFIERMTSTTVAHPQLEQPNNATSDAG